MNKKEKKKKNIKNIRKDYGRESPEEKQELEQKTNNKMKWNVPRRKKDSIYIYI